MCRLIVIPLVALLIHSRQSSVDGGGLCGKFSGLTGTVRSPQQNGQSTDYPPNTRCDYRVKTPQGYTIRARFDYFKVKWSPRCLSDYLKLSQDKKKWSQPYCGDRLKRTFETCGNKLFVRFVSDGVGSARGYQMTFTAVDFDECSPSLPRGCKKGPGRSMCQQICINTPGSYRCACQNGFQLALNGRSCEQISRPQPSPRVKVGHCPSILSGKTRARCTVDDDSSCSGTMKCCESKFGYMCKEPTFDFQSPNELSTALYKNFFSLTNFPKATGRVAGLTPGCQPTCLTILLDRSGSIGFSNFRSILNFLAALLSNMCSQAPCLSTTAISYASDVRVELECGQYACGPQLYEAVKKIRYRSGFTFLDLALESAKNRMVGSSSRNCGRSSGNCQQIVFVLTDGKSNGDRDPVGLARQLERDTGAKIFTFGVTENVNGSELSAVASQELEVIKGTVINRNVFMSRTFSALDDLTKIINKSHGVHPCSHHLRGGCDHNCIAQGEQFVCSCREGYELGNDRKSCSDVNECRQSNGLCQHRCINTVGSFRCECHNGFSTQTNGRCEKQCQITDRPGDCRVRKDFYSMSSQERERFIQVFKLVTTQPPYKRLYDNLIAIHEREFDNGIHSPQQFLPWHRWFVVAVENLLRCADPTMTIPYWDYSYTCRSPWDPNVCLDNLWGDNVRSIGGNGTGRFHHVATGPFGYPGWRLTPSAETDALRRSFRGRELPCLPAIQRFLSLPCNSGTIQDVDVALAGPLHSPVHFGINGTMWSHSSANAPEFYLLHSFIDKLWKDWQSKGPRCKDQTTTSPDFVLTATGGVRIRHVQDMDKMSVNSTTICVKYEEPSHCLADMVLGRLAGSGNNLQSITGLPSLRPSYMTVEEATFTSRSGAEVQRMLDMDKKLQPSGPGGRSSASPAWSKVEKVLGFKLSGLS